MCGFLGVREGVLAEVPPENVTAHPEPTARHRLTSGVLRAASAATAWLPGHPGAGVIDRLERSLQDGARPRQSLTWEQRGAMLPAFEADIRLLESLTGEDLSDWLAPRGDSGGLVGSRPTGQGQARNGRPRG